MARPRAERQAGAGTIVQERLAGKNAGDSCAPWFFEATLKQEIQRRKGRRTRAASLVRVVTRVVLPGSMIVFAVFCGVLALL
jgi:hypothetical protein